MPGNIATCKLFTRGCGTARSCSQLRTESRNARKIEILSFLTAFNEVMAHQHFLDRTRTCNPCQLPFIVEVRRWNEKSSVRA
jgi:hypothetical protein